MGKHMYIAAITNRAPHTNPPSKGMIKIKIAERMVMVIYKGGGNSLPSTSNRPMPGFLKTKKVGEIPNELFPLVITTIVGHFYISRIVID